MTNREKSEELDNLISNINNAIDELSEDFQEYIDRLEEIKFDVMEEQKQYEEQADAEALEEAKAELEEREREYRSIQGF